MQVEGAAIQLEGSPPGRGPEPSVEASHRRNASIGRGPEIGKASGKGEAFEGFLRI